MHLLPYCVFLLLFSTAANGQPMESTNPDELTFPAIPFMSFKGVQESIPFTLMPKYPLDAVRNEICGEVLIALKIGVDGSVMDTKIMKSEPPNVFDKAVTEAISKWQFKRVTSNGEPIVYQTQFPFKFRVEGADGSRCPPNHTLQGTLRDKAAPL